MGEGHQGEGNMIHWARKGVLAEWREQCRGRGGGGAGWRVSQSLVGHSKVYGLVVHGSQCL